MTACQLMVDAADLVMSNNNSGNSIDRLIVSANEVTASVILVVSAARVKQVPFTKTEEPLEKAAFTVTQCSKQLVDMCQQQQKSSTATDMTLKPVNAHEYKTIEMEQQVKILGLEKTLQNARQELSMIRKMGYSE